MAQMSLGFSGGLVVTDGQTDLTRLVFEVTAGIPRVIIALWVAAHRVAFERKEDSLRLDDFRRAANIYLAPVMPAVEALKGKNPFRLARYEDLIKQNDNFWEGFWSSVTTM